MAEHCIANSVDAGVIGNGFIKGFVKSLNGFGTSCNVAADEFKKFANAALDGPVHNIKSTTYTHDYTLDHGKKLIARTCANCGGKLDGNLCCIFCGTEYDWR